MSNNAKFQQNRFFQVSKLKKDLKGKSVRGGTFTVAAQATIYLLRFGSTAILARILTPQDYGLVAMTLVITGFALIFSDGGLSWATVQNQDIGHAQVSTLFWINVMIGLLIAFTLVAISPWVAAFYKENRLREITCVLASTFVTGGLMVQHQALLKRNMRFKTLATIDILSTFLSIAIGITMAYIGFKYWSLVGMAIGLSLAKLVCVWVVIPWKPGLPRLSCGVESFLRFGLNIMGFNVVNYFSRNLDKILIGKFWGAELLGFYQKSYTLLLFPIAQINAPLASVVIPTLSRLNHDPLKFKRYFLGVFKIVASLVVPIIFTISIFADQVVEVWLGARWLECAVLFRFLSVAALLGGLSHPVAWLLISIGMTRRVRNLGIATSILIVIGFLSGLKFGAEGVALGYSAAMCPATVIAWVYGLRNTDIKFSEVLKIIMRPACAGIIAGILGMTVLISAEQVTKGLFAAGLGGLVFCFTYIFVLLIVFRQWSFFIDIVKAWKQTDQPDSPILR